MSKQKAANGQKVVLYGVTGLAGSRIWQLLGSNFRIISPPHSHLNLADIASVTKHINDTNPDQIVYAAGLTKVDIAEKNPKLAYFLNEKIPAKIAKVAANSNIPFIYMSTDAIFDGRQYDRPYRETDKPNPLSVYGKSKLAGEEAILTLSKNNVVARTIMLYSANHTQKKDFARLAHEALKNKESFTAIADQIINPTFVDDFAMALGIILRKRAKGVYHIAATDSTTNLGFVKKIAKVFNLNKNLITKAYFDEFFKDKPAPRTKCCWLDTTKFRKDFGVGILRTIDASLKDFKNKIEKIEAQPINL